MGLKLKLHKLSKPLQHSLEYLDALSSPQVLCRSTIHFLADLGNSRSGFLSGEKLAKVVAGIAREHYNTNQQTFLCLLRTQTSSSAGDPHRTDMPTIPTLCAAD
jgi:hypothetical protein